MMLLDTSGLLCLLHTREPQHLDAVALFDSAWRRITHSYILTELVALADIRGVARSEALSYVADLQDSTEVETVWVDEALHREALSFLRQRMDKPFSLCDGVSFLLMRERGITEALTTDRHFEQAGYVRLLD